MTYILVFGDSITNGVGDEEEGGWVNRLNKHLIASFGNKHVVYNLGIDGDNTEGLLKRFRSEAIIRRDDEEENIILFAIGINDSQFLTSEQKSRISENDFRNNISELIRQAKEITSNIIFVGLTPVEEGKTTPIPWSTDKSYTNDLVEKYDDIIRDACKQNKILFVDVLKKFKQVEYESMLADGLHPNGKGHEEIFKQVLQTILNIPS